jgi:hypothetical protein
MFRHRQADHHHRDRPGAPVDRDHRGADHGTDTEERPVRQAGQEPGGHQEFVAVGNGREHVAEDEHRHQPEQQPLPSGPGSQRRDHRCAYHDPDRVRRDDVPGGRDGDVDARRDLWKQAHGDELGGSDRETTDRQGQQGQADVLLRVRSHRCCHG